MLTMQGKEKKLEIVKEAFRLLKRGGRYGIHETCFLDDVASKEKRTEAGKALKSALRVGAQPLLLTEWKELLTEAGFSVIETIEAPMSLLSPKRLVEDEGFFATLRFISRVLRSPGAPSRLKKIRGVFSRTDFRSIDLLQRKRC